MVLSMVLRGDSVGRRAYWQCGEVVLVQVAVHVRAKKGLEVQHLRVVRRYERLIPDRRGAAEACSHACTATVCQSL